MAYPEGGVGDFVHQLPVRHSWGRPVAAPGSRARCWLWSWYFRRPLAIARRACGMEHCGCLGPTANLRSPGPFRAGLAAKWTGPEMNAMQGMIAIEGLEIAHQGIDQVMVR